MKTEWFSDIPSSNTKEREQRRAEVRAAREALKRLDAILNKKEESALASMLKVDTYSHASWPYEQADHVATLRVLRELRDLINLDQGE